MKKLLIANRGEIACRIIRAAKDLGIATVAIYSTADKYSLHCELADEAFLVGDAPAKASYLNQQVILDIAVAANVDAIHPGYGFMAENSEFARRVISEKILWVGPSPDCIDVMGDKDSARKIAKAANVPVLPGSARFNVEQLTEVESMAANIGFPLLVKATAGGGGIGMKLVTESSQLLSIVESTANLAQQAFGNGTLYLERYITNARHIEIQVFGFGDGKAVHLFERECSVQRRFQKIIEECPAANLPLNIVDKMAQAAVILTKHQNYQGAGTVEFVLDAETLDFFFLEMNTRVQVEHPVTEMVTGLDIVKMQLLQAQGTQKILQHPQIKRQGAAIECRLYAEDPSFHFIPSPGKLDHFELGIAVNVDNGSKVRIDTGYRVGDEVTIHYDPMLAKLIVWAPTRQQAISAMVELVKTSTVSGVKHNLKFLQSMLEHSEFKDGVVTTNFVDQQLSQLI